MFTFYAAPTDPTAAAIARTLELLAVLNGASNSASSTPGALEGNVTDPVRKKSHQRLGLC